MSSYNEPRSPRSAKDIKRIAELEEENKKLQEWSLSPEMIEDTSAETIEEFERDVRDNWKENTELQEELDNEESAEGLDLVQIKFLTEQNKKLQEQLECEEDGYPTSDWFTEKLDFHIKYHFTNEGGEYYDALKDLKEKPKSLDDLVFGSLNRLQEQLTTSQYQYDMTIQIDNKKIADLEAEVKELKEEFIDESDSDEEEELSKYEEEGSDWARGYGFSVKDGEYREVMAAGGDHFEDYVIKKDGCFIHNGCGYSAVAQFISCPKCLYIKVVHIGETYELEEGETDMYLMITECYQKEIMEYCDDEEQPDSP